MMTSIDANALQTDPAGMSFLHDVIASGGIQPDAKAKRLDASTVFARRRSGRPVPKTRRPEVVG